MHLVQLLFFIFVNSVWASQSVRCRQSGLFPGAYRKSSRTGFVSCCSLSPLSDLGWAIQWGLLNTCSTRWTLGRQAERRQCRMCTSAESRQRRRKTETQSHSPTIFRGVAGGAKARWASPCCCGALPMSCCIETVPRRQSSCQPIHVLVLTCMRCPLQTCITNRRNKKIIFDKYWWRNTRLLAAFC